MLFNSTTNAQWKGFYSSEYSVDAALRPKLTIIHHANKSMLDLNDDIALLDGNNHTIDYVAWGSDAGTDDDDAVAAGVWTDGTFIDTSTMASNATLGRDKYSTDNDGIGDWCNATTSKADPYGVNATMQTPLSQNIDIPEFDEITFFMMNLIVVGLILKLRHRKKRSRK